jgi:hypothetical protein
MQNEYAAEFQRWRWSMAVFVSLLVICGQSRPAIANVSARPLFVITSIDGSGQVTRVTGVAIARHGWILTSAAAVESARNVTAGNSAFGAVTATVIAVDEPSGLALLRAPVNPAPLKFAMREAEPGDRVSSATAQSQGKPIVVFGALSGAAASGSSLMHNALFDVHGYGGPLLNECDEVVGLNRAMPATASALAPPRGYAEAETLDVIEEFVGKFGVSPSRAPKRCIPAAVLAAKRATEADAKALAAEHEATENRAAKLVALNDAAAARVNAASAEAARRKAQAQAKQKQATADRIKRWSLWGGVAAGSILVLIIALAWFLVVRSRRRRNAAEAAADHARAAALHAKTPPDGAYDILLEGQSPSGERFAIKIPALALGDAHGRAVIGRNPGDAEFIVNQESISRKQCRLFVKEAQILIEDLGSTNGTLLNGQEVRESAPIHDGDSVRLGDVSFTIRFRT